MIKLLIGGSPCTFWSIAQKNNRETEAEGLGWELFKNYLIAKEKFKPDFFLYENNKSAACVRLILCRGFRAIRLHTASTANGGKSLRIFGQITRTLNLNRLASVAHLAMMLHHVEQKQVHKH